MLPWSSAASGARFLSSRRPVSVYLTLLTSMFMHGSLMHLLGNMWFLWIFGDNVEDDLSHGRYLVFYLVTGVIASLSHVVTTFVLGDNPFIPSLGASGAISGVMGGYLVLHPQRRVRVIIFRMSDRRPGLCGGRSLVRVSADQRVRRDRTRSAVGWRRRVHGTHRRVRRRGGAREAVCRRQRAGDASSVGMVKVSAARAMGRASHRRHAPPEAGISCSHGDHRAHRCRTHRQPGRAAGHRQRS